MKRFSFYLIIIAVVVGASLLLTTQGSKKMYANVNSVGDLKHLFPKTVGEIKDRVTKALNDAKKEVEGIIAIESSEKNFVNTIKKLDELSSLSNLAVLSNSIQILEMVSPVEEIRNAAHEAILKIQEFFIDAISTNVELYKAFKAYVEHNAKKENLDEKDWYFLNDAMKGFEHSGLQLPENIREQVKQLKKDLSALCLQFETNIASDLKTITAAKEELAGISDDFLNQRKKDDQDNYIIEVNFPTYLQIMENCSVEQTRKKMFRAYLNRAYPVNDTLIKEIIAKRDQIAQLLGFKDYASYDLDQQMVENPERARAFLQDLLQQVQKKAEQELKQLTSVEKLPPSVTFDSQGRIYPWNLAYLKNWYKINFLNIDEQKVAEYFPMQKTIAGLLSIYEKFFSLQFRESPISGLWHEDLILLEVYPEAENKLLGYFILDLYPRPYKYTHACHATIVPSTFDAHGKPNVAVSLVIANFPKGTDSKPSLLERKYVETFFHEFGHALHALLGRTKMASLSGTSVKTDFVEMPSQMLEEWLEDKDILKMISSHYVTGEPLSDELIDIIISLKKFEAGLFLQRQIYFALLSLDLFDTGAHKDPHAVCRKLAQTVRPHIVFDDQDHDYASFGHLTGYGAKYYSYLWSKVFALDLFYEIKKHGLLNPEIGKKYAQEVIGQGGSVDPNQLLETFLGRKPTQQAFLKDLGLV